MDSEQGHKRLPPGLSFKSPAVLLATWFGAGILPKAPGTWGSLAALPFAWILHSTIGGMGLAAAAVGLFFIGLWSSGVYAATAGDADPAPVVIDEVVGQWLTLAAIQPDLLLYGAGFVLFRIADIAKPWPVSWAERRLPGSLGIMADDVLAAAYAGAAVYALSLWTADLGTAAP